MSKLMQVATYFELEEKIYTNVIEPSEHTMPARVFKDYVSKTKFSEEQYAVINECIEQNVPIEIYGIYDGWLEQFLSFKSLSLIGERITRPRVTKHKMEKTYNVFRPILINVIDGRNARRLMAIVFPSREYVAQYAEILATYVDIFSKSRNVAYNHKIVRYHYRRLEQSLTTWTELDQDLQTTPREMSLVIMGEIDLLLPLIQRLDFPNERARFIPLGIDKIFGIHIVADKKQERCICFFGAKHSYWGSASGFIAASLARAGAKHIIYSAKAGTFVGEEHIHRIFCPDRYLLLTENTTGPQSRLEKFSLKSPIRDIKGFADHWESGGHLTVPTVTGETKEQRRIYGTNRPATIDNEIGYIAKNLSEYESESGREISFTALHFATDYLQERPGDQEAELRGNLASKPEAYYDTKLKQFGEISSIINTYAILTDLTKKETLLDGRIWDKKIHELLDAWDDVRAFLASASVDSLSRPALIDLCLKARYAAYYHADIDWGVNRTTELSNRLHLSVKGFDKVLLTFQFIQEYYKLSPARRRLDQNTDFPPLRQLLQKTQRLCERSDHKYVRFVLQTIATQISFQIARCSDDTRNIEISATETYLSSAINELAATELCKEDMLFENMHLQRLKAAIHTLRGDRVNTCRCLEDSLLAWQNFNEHINLTAPLLEIALIKIDLLGAGFVPKSETWYESIVSANFERQRTFDLAERFERALANVQERLPPNVTHKLSR